ncbi:unnamed protein product [Arabidopsis thaliana]|uniref:Peptidyl-prolyl cis-trans isomerase n=1 Tax=Arabidopsis thaliana TaxID=3702 RepID=A0A5S9XAW6_ARATH|nr:unnamed protein product [Arabidopsis thaliana]
MISCSVSHIHFCSIYFNLIDNWKSTGSGVSEVTETSCIPRLLSAKLRCNGKDKTAGSSKSKQEEEGSKSHNCCSHIIVGHNLSPLVPKDTNTASGQKTYDLPGFADINTSKGLITVELFKEGSPEVVDKFLDLCQKDHFKGMPFQRVIKNYLVQAGHSPSSIPVEEWTAKGKLRGRLHIGPKHEAFMLGTPKNKGNNKDFELLITTAPIPDLNDQLIVFGRVLKGEDVVQEIEEVDTDEHFQPKSPIGITGVVLKLET